MLQELKYSKVKKLSKYNPLVIITPKGDVVEVHIKDIGFKKVKLAFVDKSKVTVRRKEVWEKINQVKYE